MPKQTVLVVDDDARFINDLEAAMNSDFSVRHARSRNDGLTMALNLRPDVIILGVIEPKGDSFLLYQRLSQDLATRTIPILVVDVRPEDHARKGWGKSEGMSLDVEGFLTRPVDFGQMKRTITRIIEEGKKTKPSGREALDQVGSVIEEMERIEKQLSN
jgi:PleD family two-component response regulator